MANKVATCLWYSGDKSSGRVDVGNVNGNTANDLHAAFDALTGESDWESFLAWFRKQNDSLIAQSKPPKGAAEPSFLSLYWRALVVLFGKTLTVSP